MTLREKLADDLKSAMKNKDTVAKDTIQIVRAGVLQIEKDQRVEITDAHVIDVVQKEIKKRREVMPDFERAQRQDLVDLTNKQLEILANYLPPQMSDEDLKAAIAAIIAKTGASTKKDMGKVMQEAKTELSGKADNTKISTTIKDMLENL